MAVAEFKPLELQTEKSIKVPDLLNHDYHAFVSHSSVDIDFSRHIVCELEKLGFKCFHSERDFQVGLPIVTNIMEGIEKCRRVVAIISKSSVDSRWVEFEVANSVSKSREKSEVILIPVLYNVKPSDPGVVPVYITERKYIEWTEPQFWDKLVGALIETVPIATALPVGNISHGLVWNYFYGFLSHFLPVMGNLLVEADYPSKFPGVPVLPKLVIVFPRSGKCPNDLGELDDNMMNLGMVTYKHTRGGKFQRPYTSSVYKVKHPDTGEEFIALMECPAPLYCLYKMEQGIFSNLDKYEKIKHIGLFREKLAEILKHPSSEYCHNKTILVQPYDPQDGRLSCIVADLIKEDLKIENRTHTIVQTAQ